LVPLGLPMAYPRLSLLVHLAITAPYKFAKLLGEAMRFVGPDRIIWGTDSAGYAAQIGAAVTGLREFQIPEELQWQYGYLPLTDEDKRKIFGGNLAGLLGIDPTVRRIGNMYSDKTKTTIDTIGNEAKTLDNIYEVIVSTPMGEVPGKAVLNVDGTSLSGVLSLMKNENAFSGGTIEDGKISFKGEMKTPIGKVPYDLTGTLINGKIDAVAKTKKGNLNIISKP